MVISVLSQKGGVGKSALSRLLATEYTRAGWRVLLADLDEQQQTATRWSTRRQTAGLIPTVQTQAFRTAAAALRQAPSYDLVVVDGRPHATTDVGSLARSSTLTLLPTGTALDDLEPAVRLAHELRVTAGVHPTMVCFVLVRVGDSSSELDEARAYLTQSGYQVLNGSLPERTAYRRALDLGRSLTETAYPTLNQRADELVQAVVDRLQELTRG